MMHSKKDYSFFIILYFLLCIGISFAQEKSDSVKVLVNWEEDYKTALKKAQDNDNIVFIYFWTVWCAPCKQLNEIVFSDPELGPAINKYVALKLNAEEGEGIILGNKYGIKGYPTFLFIDSNEEQIGIIVGTRSNEEYLSLINNKGKPVTK